MFSLVVNLFGRPKALFSVFVGTHLSSVVMLVLLTAVTVVPLAETQAATITIINKDAAGEGFNDPTGFTPVGGNTATTLGAARMQAAQEAANLLATMIVSSVTIQVDAYMDPLAGPLGLGGPVTMHKGFVGAPDDAVLYSSAQANSIFGADLNPAQSDILVRFESVEATSKFYYGLDGNPSAQSFDFMSVVLHELVHGLGFATQIDLATGKKVQSVLGDDGLDDAFMLHLEHHGAAQPEFPLMTDAQRLTAITAGANLHWVGANAVSVAAGHALMHGSATVSPGSNLSHFEAASELMAVSLLQGTANHSLGLAKQVLIDMGWNVIHLPLQANHVPVFVGSPAVIGVAGAGASFRLQNATVSDPDGDSVTLSYQWQKNGVTIAGAIQSGYSAVAADAGSDISCVMTALDSQGASTSVTATQVRVSGPAVTVAAQATAYQITPQNGAVQYQWEKSERLTTFSAEGAEAGLASLLDKTSAAYALIVTDLVASGTSAFHLAMPNLNSVEYFTLNRTFRPDLNATVQFNSRLGWASSGQVAALQVSDDGGDYWKTVWSQAGTNSAGENVFTQKNVSLAAYENSHVMIRFSYRLDLTSGYTGTTTGIGFYIDDITVSNSSEIINSAVITQVGTAFNVSAAVGNSTLRARAQDAQGVWWPWGADLDVVMTNDTVAPVITLNGGPATVVQGQPYVDAGATAADNVDGNISANIVVNNGVNVSAIGTYIVTYNVSDAATNAAAQVSRTVQVVADTPPTISLLGSSPLTIIQGATYLDAGATAVDDVDGNVSANVTVLNQVNSAVVGTYQVTYNVSDAAGNAALQRVRSVNVIPVGGAANRGAAVQVSTAGTTNAVEVVSTGEVISSFSLTAASGTPPAGITTPYGVLSYSTTVPVGSLVQTVTLTFSTALPATFSLYKVDNAGAYTLITQGAGADQWLLLGATNIALTLTDGGVFDLDGLVNGVIVDPLAVGVGTTPVAAAPAAPAAAAAGGGGCVQGSGVGFDPVFVMMLLFSLVVLSRPMVRSLQCRLF